jgi:hypothetical protein
MHVSLTIKKPNNKLTVTQNFPMNTVKRLNQSVNRELQLDSRKNNNKKNLSKSELIMRKLRVMQKFIKFLLKFGRELTSMVYHKSFTQSVMLPFVEYKLLYNW